MKKRILLSGLITSIIIASSLFSFESIAQAATIKTNTVDTTLKNSTGNISQPVSLRAFEYYWSYRINKNNKLEKRLFCRTTGQFAPGSTWVLV